MAEVKNFSVHLDGNQQELRNWKFQELSADPTGGDLWAGRMWRNTTDNRIKYFDGAAVRAVVYLADLESFSAWNGTHDASTGIPTSGSGESGAIRGGDRWLVGTAGTIAGIGGSSDNLEVGDIIIAQTDGAAAAADFTVIQSNVDLTGAVVAETHTVASVPADADTAIGTGLATVHSIETLIASKPWGVSINYAAKTVHSNVALTNLEVRVLGTL